MSIIISWISLMVSVVSVSYAAKNYRKSLKQDEAKQARQVTCWLNHATAEHDTFIGNNSSSECIYNVLVFMISHKKNPHGLSESFFDELDYSHYFYQEIVPPNESVGFTFDHTTTELHLVPQIFFTDSNNIQWVRYPNGKLKKYNYIDVVKKSKIMPNEFVF